MNKQNNNNRQKKKKETHQNLHKIFPFHIIVGTTKLLITK
jgi:hypothetical protein